MRRIDLFFIGLLIAAGAYIFLLHNINSKIHDNTDTLRFKRDSLLGVIDSLGVVEDSLSVVAYNAILRADSLKNKRDTTYIYYEKEHQDIDTTTYDDDIQFVKSYISDFLGR